MVDNDMEESWQKWHKMFRNIPIYKNFELNDHNLWLLSNLRITIYKIYYGIDNELRILLITSAFEEIYEDTFWIKEFFMNRIKFNEVLSNHARILMNNKEYYKDHVLLLNKIKKNTIKLVNYEKLIDQIENKIECKICYEFKTNIVTSNCGHLFCNDCILKCGEHNIKCPICKMSFYKIKLYL